MRRDVRAAHARRAAATRRHAPLPAARGPARALAGHYDTVPAQGNIPGRIEDGWVHGLGAAT